MTVRALASQRNTDKRAARTALISKATGKTDADVREEIARLAQKTDARLTFSLYFQFGLYEADANLPEKLAFLSTWEAGVSHLREIAYRIACAHASLDEMNNEWDTFVSLVAPQLGALCLDEFMVLARAMVPAIESDKTLLRRYAADAAIMCAVLRFTIDEFTCYEFFDKTLAERDTYVSGDLRAQWLSAVNTPEARDTIDSKSAAYRALTSWYGRVALTVAGSENEECFVAFCADKQQVVVKPDADSLGRGVELVDVASEAKARAAFRKLIDRGGSHIVEELIVAHPAIRALNPSSVNTVRIIVSRVGDHAVVRDCFMKVGRAGSFIDNGGAGGILVLVDPETGRLKGEGVDELGVRYACHPDNQFVFDKHALPQWSQALDVAKQALLAIDGLNVAGWDLALTAAGAWIIVEGNANTQFMAQQMTRRRGIKQEALEWIRPAIETRPWHARYIETVVAEGDALRLGKPDKTQAPARPEDARNLVEKLAWIRTNIKNPLATCCADKQSLQDFVTDKLGDDWQVPVSCKPAEIVGTGIMKALVLCKNGRPAFFAAPLDLATPATFTWYRITDTDASVWSRGRNNPFDNKPLCLHAARMAKPLCTDLPLGLVQFSLSPENEGVDFIEFCPSEAFYRTLPRGIRMNLSRGLRLK